MFCEEGYYGLVANVRFVECLKKLNDINWYIVILTIICAFDLNQLTTQKTKK